MVKSTPRRGLNAPETGSGARRWNASGSYSWVCGSMPQATPRGARVPGAPGLGYCLEPLPPGWGQILQAAWVGQCPGRGLPWVALWVTRRQCQAAIAAPANSNWKRAPPLWSPLWGLLGGVQRCMVRPSALLVSRGCPALGAPLLAFWLAAPGQRPTHPVTAHNCTGEPVLT